MSEEKQNEQKKYTKEEIEEARMKLVEARVKLLFNHTFFGQLALRLGLHAADSWCPTAATDGRKMYFSPGFIEKLDVQECAFVIAHELGHCIYEHMLRREDRDPKLWNIAGDYIINNMIDTEIVQGGSNSCAKVPTGECKPFLDHKYDGWTTEEVYDDLFQQVQAGGDPSKDGELIDVHIDFDCGGGEGEEDDKAGSKGDGKLSGLPKPLSEEEKKALSNEIRDAMIQAAQSAGAGNVPGDMQRMIKELIEPKLDWRDIIRAQIESSLKSNYTWLRPNRKGWHMPAILPGMDRDFKIDVVLAIDTSGSISQDMLTDFVSEVAGIMEQYEDYKIQIWQFDTAVYGYDCFTHDDGRDITEYEIKGGGGTEFEVNWDYMKENEIEPDQFIMFTDGQPWSSWGDEDYCDTVFLIHTAYGKPEAPFGQTVYYEDARTTD